MSDHDPPHPDIVITFRPLPDDTPPSVRVRALLKLALRRLALKCISVRGADEADVNHKPQEESSNDDTRRED